MVPYKHPVTAWLAEYAAVLINMCEVGKDGRTAYERSTGKTAKLNGIEFGEKVLLRRTPIGSRMATMTCLWVDGVSLGGGP